MVTPKKTTSFFLELRARPPLHIEVSVPPGDATVLDLVPAIHSLCDAVVEDVQSTAAVACTRGCDACCHQLIMISEYEAMYLADTLRMMDPPTRKRLVLRFTESLARLDEAGLLDDMTHVFDNAVHDGDTLHDLKVRYWNLRIPCPFLEDSACAIHARRPLICRQYLVSSNPDRCRHLYSGAKPPAVVELPVDVGGTLASFSGHGIQHSRVMPLVFSLLMERSIRSRGQAVLPGVKRLGRFVDLMTTCFCSES